MSRIVAPVLVGMALVAILGVAAGLAPGGGSPWRIEPPINPRRTGHLRHPLLKESSGAAVSRRQPGVVWTLNDSGSDPWIFATDTLGRDLGALVVSGARNRDWEAITLGPCGARDCLYIADTGDNVESLRTARIYRVPEPAIPSRTSRTRPAEVLEFRYPGGARDVEAAFVTPDGAVYLISKRRGGTPVVYRIRPDAWKQNEVATAEVMGKLPIDVDSFGNQVTDAALSPSATRVAVRTYLAIYQFMLTSRGALVPLGVACDATGLQLQGEGISWLDDHEMVLTSEGGFGTPGTVVLLACGSG